MSNPVLLEINPSKMQTPHSTPIVKSIPDAPEKNLGKIYPLPALAAAKLEGIVRNLDNEFIMAMPDKKPDSEIKLPPIPKLTIPSGSLDSRQPEEPESGSLAPRLPDTSTQMPENDEEDESYSEWYERQVQQYKEDMREERRWQ